MVELSLSLDFDPPVERKWPPAATLGFILATCGGFWAAVAIVAARLF